MVSAKLFLLVSVVVAVSMSVSACPLDYFFPTIMSEYYQFGPTKEGYRFNLEEPNGSKREEIGVIMNPGTPEQEIVVMGTYSTYDEKSGIESMTVYTADKDGYKPRVVMKNRKLNGSQLKSLTG